MNYFFFIAALLYLHYAISYFHWLLFILSMLNLFGIALRMAEESLITELSAELKHLEKEYYEMYGKEFNFEN